MQSLCSYFILHTCIFSEPIQRLIYVLYLFSRCCFSHDVLVLVVGRHACLKADGRRSEEETSRIFIRKPTWQCRRKLKVPAAAQPKAGHWFQTETVSFNHPATDEPPWINSAVTFEPDKRRTGYRLPASISRYWLCLSECHKLWLQMTCNIGRVLRCQV